MENPSESIFINRELSWLDFDSRVLALAKEKSVPLAERIKFAAIFGSNMDEFFMVRVGSLYDQTLLKNNKLDIVTHMTPSEQIAAITPRVAELQAKCDKYYQHLLSALKENKYIKVDFDHLDKQQEHYWKAYFTSEILPILSPQVVDQRHPFPFLRNKEIYYAAQLNSKSDGVYYGIIPLSGQFEQLLFIKNPDGTTSFAFADELIAHYAASIFNKSTLQNACLFRVTRNADITVDEGMMDHDIDFRDVMSELLKKRRKLAAVRLQFWPSAPQEIVKFLRDKLVVPADRCYTQTSSLDPGLLFRLASRVSADSNPAFSYPPARPIQAPADYDLYAEAHKHDVLLSYPYQSIRPFIRMLMKAGSDPDVVSIKMTLYRMASDSQIVQALINAAENGKEVTAMVELRARFDEQNNIDWSERLEEAGCRVLYGFEGYKVHSKICLITYRNRTGIHYITQIGTGNYNEKTAKMYTDYSLMTSRQEIGEDAAVFFQNMSISNLNGVYKHLIVSPTSLKQKVLALMDEEIAKGENGRIIMKMNSVTDMDFIRKVTEASQAGVKIDLIVRGICCILPGIKGKTENLRVTSIVGRYLEHPRLFVFGKGADATVYIGSADMMTRNTEKRVEVACPVYDVEIRKRLFHQLHVMLSDNVKARAMTSDGTYVKKPVEDGASLVNAQDTFMRESSQAKRPAEANVPKKKKEGFLTTVLKIFRKKQ